jgi:hypothetical protein
MGPRWHASVGKPFIIVCKTHYKDWSAPNTTADRAGGRRPSGDAADTAAFAATACDGVHPSIVLVNSEGRMGS